ncbi:MAG: hypothetical protein PHX02_04940 [Oscillospiraceae bacterium]|nr:hypothetical protein [Oscillospiraceae bacterium]
MNKINEVYQVELSFSNQQTLKELLLELLLEKLCSCDFDGLESLHPELHGF